jgi:subtilisin family serine protease
MGFPASLPNVIAVGASNATNHIAHFSSQDHFASNFVNPKLVALGVDVLSASNIRSFHFEMYSGTSMATPNVSGLVVLLLGKYQNRSFNNIQKILQSSSNQTAKHPGETCIPSNELNGQIMSLVRAEHQTNITEAGNQVKFLIL